MSSTTTAVPLRHDAEVIGLVGLTHAASHFSQLVMPPLFPWLMKDFGLSYTQVGFLVTVFFVISGIGQAVAGFVVDRLGARPVLLFGVATVAASAVVLGLATDYAGLVAAAAVAGVGNSIFHPADFTLLNRRVSTQRLGHAFSVHGLALATASLTAYLLGSAGGTVVGGFIAARTEQNDHVIGIALGASAVVALILAWGVLPGWSVMVLMVAMGFGAGVAGPSRDLLVRKAATSRFGRSSYGRIYGFVYSGLDIGLAATPLVFGPMLDEGRFSAALIGVAVLQAAALLSAVRVGQGVRLARVAPIARP